MRGRPLVLLLALACAPPGCAERAPRAEAAAALSIHAALEPARAALLDQYAREVTKASEMATGVEEGRALIEAVDLRFALAFAADELLVRRWNDWAASVEEGRDVDAPALERAVVRAWCGVVRELSTLDIAPAAIAAVPIPCEVAR